MVWIYDSSKDLIALESAKGILPVDQPMTMEELNAAPSFSAGRVPEKTVFI